MTKCYYCEYKEAPVLDCLEDGTEIQICYACWV